MSESGSQVGQVPSLEDIRSRHIEMCQTVTASESTDQEELRRQILAHLEDIHRAGKRTVAFSRRHELLQTAQFWQVVYSSQFKENVHAGVADAESENMLPDELLATQRDGARSILGTAKDAKLPDSVINRLRYELASFL